MKKRLFTFVLVSSLVFSVACGQDVAKESEIANKESNENSQSSDEKDSKRKEVTVDNVGGQAPDDQGDYDVWLQGEATLNDKQITVDGSTNLLPGAKLTFSLEAIEGAIVGSSGSAIVEEDGTFHLESKVPDQYDYPVIYAEITFQPDYADEDIKKHYAQSGENLKGPFVRLYEENEQLKKQIALQLPLGQNDEAVTVPIEAPKWEEPQDYGSPEVWVETEVTEDGEFVYIDGKSNLLEGTSLRGDINVSGYITPGLVDHVVTNPDGSFHMAITHPERKIDDVAEYELLIRFIPSDGNNYHYIYETYGEKGDKLQGNLVQEENGESIIAFKQKVSTD